jgi:hypothetical protein
MFLLVDRQDENQDLYVPIRDASISTGYNIQYLRRMLRQGKIHGLKIGQIWLIKKISLDLYLAYVNRTNDQRYGPQYE